MANYTLTIDLQGADKAEGAIDSLLSKVKDIGSGKMPSFMDWMDAGSEAPVEGEKAGEKFADGITKGATKKLKSFNILDAWGKSIVKGTQDFWNDAVKNGKNLAQSPPIKGLRDIGGADLAKIFNLPDINSYSKPPPIPQKIDLKKVLIGFGLGFSNPYVGSRLLSDELGKGSGKGIAGGLFGKGGIGGFAEIFAAFKLFKFATDTFSKAVEQARGFYAKALQSGLGLNYQIKRTMLAQLLGVSETEVNKFGVAVAYLNPKIDYAAKTLAAANLPLTTAGVEFSVLKYDLDALVATIASDVAPAITLFIRMLEGLVNMISKVLNNKYFKILMETMTPGAQLLGLLNTTQKLTGGQIPSPQSFMKQLPASAWQHMGLVIGGGGNTTNELIKKSNGYLKVIAGAASNTNGTPRAFGLSPMTANP